MPMRLLIVDDSPAIRRMIQRVLALSGLEANAEEAGDGGAGLARLRERLAEGASFDALLTDINMPGMNGEQLLEEVRRTPGLEKLPVVVISTDATRDRMERMRRLGVSAYLSKPFTPEGLRGKLEEVTEAVQGGGMP
jgi:two-component system chemotaxis response regulator CheY